MIDTHDVNSIINVEQRESLLDLYTLHIRWICHHHLDEVDFNELWYHIKAHSSLAARIVVCINAETA